MLKLGTFASELKIEILDAPEEDKFGEPTEYGDYDAIYLDEEMYGAVPYFDVETEMYFELFTRQNVVDSFRINISDPDLMSTSHFNAMHPTRIAVHGWKASSMFYEMLKEGN